MIKRHQALVAPLLLVFFVASCSSQTSSSPTSSTIIVTTTTTTTTTTTSTTATTAVTNPPTTDTTEPSVTPTTSSPPEPGTSTSVPKPADTETGSVPSLLAPEDGVPVVDAADRQEVATDLTSEPRCDATTPGRTASALSWRAPAEGTEQRVDLTFFFQGFESGNFVATPTLPPGQMAYLLLDTEPGVQYQWRVLTRTTNEWISSEVATFRGAVCVVDEP